MCIRDRIRTEQKLVAGNQTVPSRQTEGNRCFHLCAGDGGHLIQTPGKVEGVLESGFWRRRRIRLVSSRLPGMRFSDPRKRRFVVLPSPLFEASRHLENLHGRFSETGKIHPRDRSSLPSGRGNRVYQGKVNQEKMKGHRQSDCSTKTTGMRQTLL